MWQCESRKGTLESGNWWGLHFVLKGKIGTIRSGFDFFTGAGAFFSSSSQRARVPECARSSSPSSEKESSLSPPRWLNSLSRDIWRMEFYYYILIKLNKLICRNLF